MTPITTGPTRRRTTAVGAIALLTVTILAAGCANDTLERAAASPATTAPRVTAPATFTATPSIGQVTVTRAEPGDELQLVDADERVVARGTADDTGSLIFYDVPPAEGYRVIHDGSASSGDDSPSSDDDAVRGVVSIYGPADLRYAWEHPGNPRVYDGIGTIERYLGGRPADVGQVYDDASPYQFVGPNTPATLLVHGGRDEIVSVVQSQRLAERLRAHGRPHVLVAPGWATHGCDYHFAGPCGQLSTFAIERFLAAVL